MCVVGLLLNSCHVDIGKILTINQTPEAETGLTTRDASRGVPQLHSIQYVDLLRTNYINNFEIKFSFLLCQKIDLI